MCCQGGEAAPVPRDGVRRARSVFSSGSQGSRLPPSHVWESSCGRIGVQQRCALHTIRMWICASLEIVFTASLIAFYVMPLLTPTRTQHERGAR